MRSVLNEDTIFDTVNQLLKTVNKITNRDENGRNNNAYYLGGSIAKYTKNLVMSFPVLCDDTLNVETSQWISKACEKNIASMMEMLFSSMSLTTTDKNAVGADLIKKIHKNIDTMSLDDWIDTTNDLVNARESYLPKLNNGQIVDAVREFSVILRTPQKRFGENFSERGLNEYLCRQNYKGETIVFEAPQRYLDKQRAALNEKKEAEARMLAEEAQLLSESFDDGDLADIPLFKGVTKESLVNEAKGDYVEDPINGQLYPADVSDREKFRYQQRRDIANDTSRQQEFDYRKAQDTKNFDYRQNKDNRDYDYRVQKDIADAEQKRKEFEYSQYRDAMSLKTKRVKDSDFRKANELQPTLMIVNFNVLAKSDNGEAAVVDRKSFVAGVKCRLIAAPSTDIAERIASIKRTQLSFKNLIRATTGEIRFAPDFLFAINQQKLDARNDAKKGEAAKIWNTLKKRSAKSNYRKLTRDKNDASAITTLVISQDTVNYVKSTTGFDAATVAGALQIMDKYNLLCIVIADETNEVAKFLYDNGSEFESLAFTVLAKEAQDKQYKKIVNLVK